MTSLKYLAAACLLSLSSQCAVAATVPNPTNGPASSTIGHCATFGNTTGNQLSDTACPGGGTPGGTSGQAQYNNSGSFGGYTVGGDATLNTGTGSLTVTKTNGVNFAPSATTDTTNASNISSGTLGASRLPLATNSTIGGVSPDGTTIQITAGVIRAVGAAPTGGAGGDLGGNYPSPTVLSVTHVTTGVLSAANGGTGTNNGSATLTISSNNCIPPSAGGVWTLNCAGLLGNDSTVEATTLVTAMQAAVTGKYTLVGAPAMNINLGTVSPVILPSNAAMQWNGTRLDASNETTNSGTGCASGEAIDITPFGGGSQPTDFAPYAWTGGPYIQGPNSTPPYNSYTTVNGVCIYGTNIYQLSNETFSDFYIYGFNNNLDLGNYEFTLSFPGFRSYYAGNYGVLADGTTTAGENERFTNGSISNIVNSSTGAAHGFYVSGAGFDITLSGMSMDYSDQLIYCSDNGTIHLFANHFETGGNSANASSPFTYQNGGGGACLIDGEGNSFVSPGQSIGTYKEPVGGRASANVLVGTNTRLALSHSRWTYGSSSGNYNTQFVTVVSGNPNISIDGLTNANGTALVNAEPSFARASPTYAAGYLTAGNLNGWQSNSTTNLFRNSAWVGAVAGTTGTSGSGACAGGSASGGTLPTNMIQGNFTSNALSCQVVGISYVNGLPELELHITGTANGTAPQFYLDSSGTGVYAAETYDSYYSSIQAQMISIGGDQTVQSVNLQYGYTERQSGGTSNGGSLSTSATIEPYIFGFSRAVAVGLHSPVTAYIQPNLTFAGTAFTNGDTVDFTVGILVPQLLLQNAPTTVNVSQVNLNVAVPGGRYGADTATTSFTPLGTGTAETTTLHEWNGANIAYSPLYLTIPVNGADHVMAETWLQFANFATGASCGLFYQELDAQGNILTSAQVDGSGAGNTTGSFTSTAASASSSGTTITYTGSTGTAAVGQTVTVTAGTGAIPNGDLITAVGAGTITLTTAPTTALSGATIQNGFVPASNLLTMLAGAVTFEEFPYIHGPTSGATDCYFAATEAKNLK